MMFPLFSRRLWVDNPSSPSKHSRSSEGVKLVSVPLCMLIESVVNSIFLEASQWSESLQPLIENIFFISSRRPPLSYSLVWPCVFRIPPPLRFVLWEGKGCTLIKPQQQKVSLAACMCMYQSHMAICGTVLRNMNAGEGVKWSVVEKVTCLYLWGE